MEISFSKNKIIQSALSPYDRYCVGYSGRGGYLTALVMGVSSFKKRFSHSGSKILDAILAYDRAEVADTYIGQINMEIVSSFCGPQGLIWGYDLAKEETLKINSILSKNILKRFKEIEIKNGENLRKAAKMLFGTIGEFHFPLLPGTHVPCAGRFHFEEGPVYLYSAAAIGIPEDRKRAACMLMEDVGKLKKVTSRIKEKILLNGIQSILELGKNHRVNYKEVFVDFFARKIKTDEIGCALIAMPYFCLAKKAFTKNLTKQSLNKWFNSVQNHTVS